MPKYRRARLAVAGAAVSAVVPTGLLVRGAAAARVAPPIPTAAANPGFPRPGGGPVAIQAWAGLEWSPDGRALLTTTVDNERRLTAHRLDVRTGRVRDTLLPAWASGAAGWAADSRRYLVMTEPADPAAVVDTAMPLLGWHDEWHVVRVAPAPPQVPTVPEVLDVRTGRVGERIRAGGLPAGSLLQLGSTAGLAPAAARRGF